MANINIVKNIVLRDDFQKYEISLKTYECNFTSAFICGFYLYLEELQTVM